MQDLLQVRKAGAQDNRLCSCLSFKQLEQRDGEPDIHKPPATLALQQQGQTCFLAGVVNEDDDTFKIKWGAPAPTGNASQCRCLCWVCISNSAGPFSSCCGEVGSCNNDIHVYTVLCFRFTSDVVVRLQAHYTLTVKRANHILAPPFTIAKHFVDFHTVAHLCKAYLQTLFPLPLEFLYPHGYPSQPSAVNFPQAINPPCG